MRVVLNDPPTVSAIKHYTTGTVPYYPTLQWKASFERHLNAARRAAMNVFIQVEQAVHKR